MEHARTKVWKRRREVTSLIVRGKSCGEIAEILNIPEYTVHNDIRVIKSGDNEALNVHTRNEINAQLYLNAWERVREVWKIFEKADSQHIALRCLRELRLNDERILKKLPPLKTLEQLEARKKANEFFDRIIEDMKSKHPLYPGSTMPAGMVENNPVQPKPGDTCQAPGFIPGEKGGFHHGAHGEHRGKKNGKRESDNSSFHIPHS